MNNIFRELGGNLYAINVNSFRNFQFPVQTKSKKNVQEQIGESFLMFNIEL